MRFGFESRHLTLCVFALTPETLLRAWRERQCDAASAKVFRQAFILIVSNGRNLDNAQVTKVDRIRSQWESFFAKATDNKMSVDTRLR